MSSGEREWGAGPDAGAARLADGFGRNLTFGMLDALGRAIVTGSYDGQRFPTEAELATQHAVSRSVTREAVKMLTAKGLLTARPRKGTTIQPPSSWNLFDPDVLRWLLERKFSIDLLRQFSELRIAIEPAAAALAAREADADAVAAIEAGYARMEAVERNEDDALDADIAFHIAILNACGNPFYRQFRDLVATALQTSIRFTSRFNGRTASLPRHRASLPAHRAVLDAIRARDEQGAHDAMRVIIEDVMALF
ncbi:MAG: FadR family transcriptional regulator [Alphaproteobacteria bacterium]|nr:FadR family transcriptional regulator [Alphaproteobacteria bacterium]